MITTALAIVIPRIASWRERRSSLKIPPTGGEEPSANIFDDSDFENGIEVTRGRSLTRETPSGADFPSNEITSKPDDRPREVDRIQSIAREQQYEMRKAESIRSGMLYHMRDDSEEIGFRLPIDSRSTEKPSIWVRFKQGVKGLLKLIK